MKTLKSLFLVCLLMLFLHTSAQTDTSGRVYQWDYKITKKEFIKRYAIDDTSRALIEFCFEQRRFAFIATPILMAGIAAGLLLQSRNSSNSDTYIVVSDGILLMAGLGTLASHSRRELLLLLKKRERHIPLPPDVQNRIGEYLRENLKLK